jgi:ascorbate-specific PTS system EIIC-type component UlaA
LTSLCAVFNIYTRTFVTADGIPSLHFLAVNIIVMTLIVTSWLLGLYFVCGTVAQWTVGQEVTTASGIVAGHAAKTHPQVSEYLGIRFGQNTEGENRFMPPKPYTSTAKISASDYVSVFHP